MLFRSGLVPPYPLRHLAGPDHMPPSGKHAQGRCERGPWLGTQRIVDPAGRRRANAKARRPEQMAKAMERFEQRQAAQTPLDIVDVLKNVQPRGLRAAMDDIRRKLNALQGKTEEDPK